MNKPLDGYTILITRAYDQSKEIIDRIRSFGGTAVCLPMIEIAAPESWNDCDESIVKIKKYEGIIFTSANAVRGFFNRIESEFPHVKEVVKRRKIYCVGEKTKATLLQYGITTHAVPEEFTADALVELILNTGPEGKTFLLPAGNLTRDIIENGLSKAGAVVDRVQVYTTKKPGNTYPVHLKDLISEQTINIVTFFSPSAVNHFFELIESVLMKDIPVAVIGETTYQTVTDYGIHPQIMPDEATGEKLVDGIVKFVRENNFTITRSQKTSL